MDAKLRQIVSKAAGVHFIVTTAQQLATIEADSKMRLFFINTEKGAINSLFVFAKGDTSGFVSVFGKGTRTQEKRGNFSISTCLEALKGGPISVINLRKFTDVDKAGIVGLNPNILAPENGVVEFTNLFNMNSFWIPKAENIKNVTSFQHLLNFGNVGNSDVSIFVTLASDISGITSEGEKTLQASTLEIDEFPALDFEMLVKNTFVDVTIFNNTFGATASTNKYYGHLFDVDGNVDVKRLNELIAIPEAGFSQKFTGSVIPGLKVGEDEVAIDRVVTNNYLQTGVILHINDDLFETEANILDIDGLGYFDETGAKKVGVSDYLYSYIVPDSLTTSAAVYPLTLKTQNVKPLDANLITYGVEYVSSNSFIGSFEQGLKIGDFLESADGGTIAISNIEILDDEAIIGVTTDTYTKVKYTCGGAIKYNVAENEVVKVNSFLNNCLVKPSNLVGYKQRAEQFLDGTATRQNEILDMVLSPGIVKGIKNTRGIRYVVDTFKSFVEPSYKMQYGELMYTLNQANKFVRFIGEEPFMEDLEKSTNPLFKQTPTGVFDINYLLDGGNKNYSTRLLTKLNKGAEFCFFFGCGGNVTGSVTRPISGLVSNLFVSKSLPFDVVANESGFLDGITALGAQFDEDDRIILEKIGWNPIIAIGNGYTIYGNLTALKTINSQQQIHNSELLSYVQENLLNLGKTEAFKKGNYSDYLRTETESKNFMESLALKGAVQADYIVICNATNNTPEIAKRKMKVVHIEYTPVDALDKVVFDLNIK